MLQGAHWSMEWVEWKTEYDNQVYTNNYNEHVAVTEVNMKCYGGAFLAVQWLRILLPMQGTRAQTLFWEDPTCRGATMPVRHNY